MWHHIIHVITMDEHQWVRQASDSNNTDVMHKAGINYVCHGYEWSTIEIYTMLVLVSSGQSNMLASKHIYEIGRPLQNLP